MGTLLPFRPHLSPSPVFIDTSTPLTRLDRRLSARERELSEARIRAADESRGWQPRAYWRGEVEKLERVVAQLSRERLRLAGPELALVKGGKR